MNLPPDSSPRRTPVAVELTGDERAVLAQGVLQWTGGPTRPTRRLAVAIGFPNVETLRETANLLWERLNAAQPLTTREWTQVQLLTEIAWASDLFGVGVEWDIITGFDDRRTAQVLRALQRKLIHYADSHLLDD